VRAPGATGVHPVPPVDRGPLPLAAATGGFRLGSAAPARQAPGEAEDRYFRSYPDRLAEAGWIADTDYGWTGLERYLFAPGSPRPPAMSLDGFPLDLGWPATSDLEGWGGEPLASGQAWWPDPPAAPAPMGALDLERYPAGNGALLSRVSLHGEDLGGMDARVQFARQDPDAEWSLATGVRKETASYLVSEFRERGLSVEASRKTRWGRWRAAVLSSTSDVVAYAPDFSGTDVRRELLRVGLGAASRDSGVSVAAVLASAGDGTSSDGRQALVARVRLPGRPALAALGELEGGGGLSGGARPSVGLAAGGPGREAAVLLGLGGGRHELALRGSERWEISSSFAAGAEGCLRADLGGVPADSQRFSMLRLEPQLQWTRGRIRAQLQAYLERDRGLPGASDAPRFSTLLPAAVREASSVGLEGRLELPGPLGTRLGMSGLVQRTRDEHGWRLPFQPPVSGHAFVALDHRTPWVPMLAHLRLTAHAEGDRRGEQNVVSDGHATLDFETVLDYGALHLQVAFYNFTDLVYQTTFVVPGQSGVAAPAAGRAMRFGITWDLWD